MTTAISVGRDIKLWTFTVSHSQLLLLGSPSGHSKTRVELFFLGVEHIDLPSRFHCETVEFSSAGESGGLVDYRFVIGGRGGLVRALTMFSRETNLDDFGSNLLEERMGTSENPCPIRPVEHR